MTHRLLVFGATGRVGRMVIDHGVAAGYATFAAVRSAPKDTPWRCVSEQVIADPLDSQAVAHAVDRVEPTAIISCLGQRRTQAWNPWSRATSPADLQAAGVRNMTAAAQRSGVRRLVAISACGVGDSRDTLGWLTEKILISSTIGVAVADLEQMEAALAASGLDWFAPRPTTLRPGAARGVKAVSTYGALTTVPRSAVAKEVVRLATLPAGHSESNRTPIVS